MNNFIEFKFDDTDVISVSELIKTRLYFVTYKTRIPEDTKNVHYVTANDGYESDENLEPLNRLSIGTVFEFIEMINNKLSYKEYSKKVIVNYSTGSERKRNNAAVLIGIYMTTQLNTSREKAAEILSQHSTISLLDSLNAVHKAITLGFIDLRTFNSDEFFSLDDLRLNWVVPKRFLIFTGPLGSSNERYLSPRRYVAFFHQVGVQAIIRLGHIKYDANPFVDSGIAHYDLSMSGSIPKDEVLRVFLELSEECRGVVLVHCREVLGRAGCLLGAYLVKHYGFAAGEAVAWIRMNTSECILEAQKKWLKKKEVELIVTKELGGKDHTSQIEKEVRVINIVKPENDP